MRWLTDGCGVHETGVQKYSILCHSRSAVIDLECRQNFDLDNERRPSSLCLDVEVK